MGFNGLTIVVSFQLFIPPDLTLASWPTFKANALHADLVVVDKRIRSGVTSKRANAMDKLWGHWEQFCLEHNVDPYLQTWDDPVPIIQVFGERYRDGRLTPLYNVVKSHTVEDTLHALGQAHTRFPP
jgi:hypothetical protein